MGKKPSRKTLKKMEQDAARGIWIGLIELDKVPAFSAWLSCRHGYKPQSPDAREVLRMWRDGDTINVTYNGKNTRCGRRVMSLWHVFECFCLGRS